MKTTGKEYFYLVSGLLVPKYIVSDALLEHLEYFTQLTGRKVELIKEYLEDDNMKGFVAEMEDLYRVLCNIHAHWLETEAARILRLVDVHHEGLCKKITLPFLENVSMLATELQMAQNNSFNDARQQYDEVARYKYIIKNLKAIITLVSNSEFEKAFDIAITIEELHEGDLGVKFMTSLVSKNASDFKKKANDLIEYYVDCIENYTIPQIVVLKKVLIVDDQPDVLMAVSSMLSNHYQVFALPDGEQALNFLRKHRVEAFILDIDMPKMNGFELAGRIRQREEYERTPMLFLTSNQTKEAVMKAPLYGVRAFVAKPPNKEVIINKLQSLL